MREKQTLSAPENRIQKSAMSRPRLIALLLALATLLVYLPVTRFDFLNYDDNDYVTGNRVVQNGLTFAGSGSVALSAARISLSVAVEKPSSRLTKIGRS